MGDIDVIEDDPYFFIDVVAGANPNGPGYIFSVVVVDKSPPARLFHFVLGEPTDDLEDICRKIVANIDGSEFEPMRRVPHFDGQGRLIE